MSSVMEKCIVCAGSGYVHPAPPPHAWLRCAACDGIGKQWAPGAPSFGCVTQLGTRQPGEIVTLGNGDHGRVLRHSPLPTRKVAADTTWIGIIDDFTGIESHDPIAYPSVVGVSRHGADVPNVEDVHADDRSPDPIDPMHKNGSRRGLFDV